MKIWLNGHFVDSAEAHVSIFDAGLQHGVGLFETMLARNKKVFRAEAHMRRLADSASRFIWASTRKTFLFLASMVSNKPTAC